MHYATGAVHLHIYSPLRARERRDEKTCHHVGPKRPTTGRYASGFCAAHALHGKLTLFNVLENLGRFVIHVQTLCTTAVYPAVCFM